MAEARDTDKPLAKTVISLGLGVHVALLLSAGIAQEKIRSTAEPGSKVMTPDGEQEDVLVINIEKSLA